MFNIDPSFIRRKTLVELEEIFPLNSEKGQRVQPLNSEKRNRAPQNPDNIFRREADGFNGEMKFQKVLIPYQRNSNWIHGKITEMIELLNDNNTPDANPSCKNCAYALQRSKYEMLK